MSKVAAGSFDDLADAYDRFRIGYADDVYDAIVEYGTVAPGARVLDVGCGTGLVALEMARRGHAVSGIDISEPMLACARARVPAASFALGRAESLPYPDASFDLVTSAQTFHWFDQATALAEVARVLRPGGVLAVWWKGLSRGDAMRQTRDEAAREVGLHPPHDLLVRPFESFDGSSFVDRRLRVIPWRLSIPVAHFLGYERSRARSRDAYGERFDDYLACLERRLNAHPGDVAVCYTHLLYLGRVPVHESHERA